MSVLAAAGPSAYWYLARGTGAISLLLLTLSVVLGILGPLRFTGGPRWPRFAIETLHRDVSLVVIAVLVVHILTSVLDSFAPITLVDSLIPFTGTYRPLWLGFGALSFDLLLALVITSLVRRRLGYRAWRTVHWLAYASWPVAVLHGLGTGSDTKLWWMLALTALCCGAVLLATCVRVARSGPEFGSLRPGAMLAAIATPVGIAIFTLVGPLQPGWARRAGTPRSLLAKAPTRVSVLAGSSPRAAPATSSQTQPKSFNANLHGTVTQTEEPNGAVIDLAMQLTGGAHGRLRVRLAGAPTDGGGLSMTGSQVDLILNGAPYVLQGQIVSLQGQQFLARVANGSGTVLDLQASLNIDSQSGSVTGNVSASPRGSGQ